MSEQTMSREKQIDEMAKLACTCFDGNCKGCPFDFYPPCPPKASATRLYNAGYRKQSEGEWIVLAEFSDGSICTECSICGEEYTYKKGQIGEHVKTFYAKYNFCPNCGASMKGGAE